MKKGVLLLLILFSIPIAYAQQYTNYSFLEMLVDINSSMEVDYETSPIIEYFDAKSNIGPVNDEPAQIIADIDYYSIPEGADVYTDENNSIVYHWTNEMPPEFMLGMTIDVVTNNNIMPVREKLKFPPENIPPDIIEYTKATEFIDINQEIINKANEIVAGQTDYYGAVFVLAEWVEQNINYSLDTLTENAVQKSSWVIANRYGVCDELTNLFISLARSVGIPARFASGQVYSNIAGGFGNHGWAEIYFPGYGWVPFDVTFKQFGWVDPTHIKVSEQKDSGKPAVEYSWKSHNANFNNKELNVDTRIVKKGSAIKPPVSMKIEAITDYVGFGSYVPILVTVTNDNDYYVPTMVVLSKATEINKKNFKNILLGPYEERNVVWVMKIPSEDPKYVYTATIEASDPYGNIATTNITYSSEFKVNTKEAAEKEAGELSNNLKKIFLREANLSCSFGKGNFYSNEEVKASCLIENLGNTKLENVKICMDDKCINEELSIGEKKNVELSKQEYSLESGKIKFTLETDNLVKYEFKTLKIIDDPKLTILDYEPLLIPYGGKANLTFNIDSESTAHNISIKLDKSGIATISKLEGKHIIILSFDTRDVNSDSVKIKWEYADETGRNFISADKNFAEITGRPWYASLIFYYRKMAGLSSTATLSVKS